LMLLRTCLGTALLVAMGLGAQNEDKRARRAEERKASELREISQRLRRLSSRSGLSQENEFLHAQVSAVLERARQAPAGSYLFDRLASAVDDLLDASEEILESRRDRRERDDDPEEAKRRTARELERTYFRVQQGDYFGRQSKESNAADYVRTARRLYQIARGAYDGGEYHRARRLADAARDIISGLEALAQAAVPIPEPPQF
jgi:hypothetical protein